MNADRTITPWLRSTTRSHSGNFDARSSLPSAAAICRPIDAPPLAVGAPHLGDVECRVAPLDGHSQEQVLQHEIVQDDDAGKAKRGVQGEAVVGVVADLVERLTS